MKIPWNITNTVCLLLYIFLGSITYAFVPSYPLSFSIFKIYSWLFILSISSFIIIIIFTSVGYIFEYIENKKWSIFYISYQIIPLILFLATLSVTLQPDKYSITALKMFYNPKPEFRRITRQKNYIQTNLTVDGNPCCGYTGIPQSDYDFFCNNTQNATSTLYCDVVSKGYRQSINSLNITIIIAIVLHVIHTIEALIRFHYFSKESADRQSASSSLSRFV